ncbi:MAG: Diguanylate cyclase (GGDEF) domain-containing protein [Thermotogales bacterium 46_20]|nr:MAG: Diguanylate cyclase (GGDEF) domain-containing protein [Thermotogales bacterium 46_20]
MTVTGAVAEMPRNAATVEKLLNLLSEGLRLGKKQGRNRVVFAPSEREQKMVMKTNYYLRSQLEKLSKLARITERTESSLLREALDDLLRKYEL